jgi:hypothetical protein
LGTWLRRRLTFANVVSLIALFAALGLGTAWALEANSVKSKHIVNGQVKLKDLADDAVNSAKVEDGSIAVRDLQGVTGTVLTGKDVAAGECFNHSLPVQGLEADDGVLVVPQRGAGVDPRWDPRLILDGYGPKAADETFIPGITVRICNTSNEAIDDASMPFYVIVLR